MDPIISNLIALLLNGGPHAISAILVLFIMLLLFDRRRMIAELDKKEDRLDKIVDDYYKGNVTLADALTSLKLVLYEIKSKL